MSDQLPRPLLMAAIVVVLLIASPAFAQRDRDLEYDAIAGEPYGVGRISLLIDQAEEGMSPVMTERTGRVYFPTYATSNRPVRRLLRNLVGAPRQVTAYFLFKGQEPLEITVATPTPVTVRVRPRQDRDDLSRHLIVWWDEFASTRDSDRRPKDYPTMVEDYLTASLARRMDLPLPEGFFEKPKTDDLTHAMRVLGGAETIRSQFVRQVAYAADPKQVADRSLPKPLEFPETTLTAPASVKIEAMANHVPPEFFYVRFGSFPNYLWFSHRLDDWGGEVGNLVSERSLDFGLNDRLQEQLCLHESALAEVLGPTVISDVALVGTDTFLRDGAAMGVLFEARNSLLLGNDFIEQRTESKQAHPEAVEDEVVLAGKKVLFLRTPDNRLRSYYAVSGDYHFVTTSRQLAQRFVEVAADGKSLGSLPEFRYARQQFPIDRGDTLFAYLSSRFLENLISPRYQVELHRRLRSVAEIDVLIAARIANNPTGADRTPIEQLVTKGLLPTGFGRRADGSLLKDDGELLVDTIRGPRGTFVPIPDVPVKGVTDAEAAASLQVAESYSASWEQMTPLIAAVSRADGSKEGLERVTFDLRATPLAGKQYKLLSSMVGAPSDRRMAPIKGDVVSFDVVLRTMMGGGAGDDYHLFGGLQNGDPRLVTGGLLEKAIGMLGGKEIEGYLGAWPKPGVLWLLGATANMPVDANGYSQFFTGTWRRLVDDYTLLSFHAEMLEAITPQLKFVPAKRPGQAWVHADNLRESKLAPMINAYGYRKASELSHGNARFLNSLVEQLHAPPENCLELSEQLLTARLVCPLGGKYEVARGDSGPARLVSTAWEKAPRGRFTDPPSDYEFPALYWLRGVEAEACLTNAELAVHADIEMPVKTRPSFQLPTFSLPFGLSAPTPAKPATPAKPQAERKENVKEKPSTGAVLVYSSRSA